MENMKKEIQFEIEDWKKLVEWLLKGDHGTSSETIACVNLGIQNKRADSPYDIWDFTRCVKLLRMFPRFRDNFHYLVKKVPEFKFWVVHWDYLEGIVNKIDKIDYDLNTMYENYQKNYHSDKIEETELKYAIYHKGVIRKEEEKAKLINQFHEFDGKSDEKEEDEWVDPAEVDEGWMKLTDKVDNAEDNLHKKEEE